MGVGNLDALQLTRDLVAMDTINPPGFEQACASHVAEILDGAGFNVDLFDFGEGRTNVVASRGGSDEKLPLCLTGHLDTVPLGNEPWTVDPFAGEIRDGRVYGRGTTDMKGGVAAMMVAAVNLSKQLDDTAGVTLVLTGGEETGCDGAKALCETPGALGEAGAIIVGEPTSNVPLVGHKGALWLRAVCRGVTAHGSTPELGVNAVYAACRAVGKVEDFGFNIQPHDMLGSPSINVGRIAGGINVNSVPDRATFDIDIRSIPGQDHLGVVEDLRGLLSEIDELEPTVDVDSVISSESDPWVRSVFRCSEDILGESIGPKTAKYFTDASVLKPAYRDPPTIILGPGDASVAHKTDEYCDINLLYQSVSIYEAIIADWCGLERA